MILRPISLAVRADPITSSNKSTAIIIATCVLLAIFILLFLSREAIKLVVLRKFQVDDLLILIATVFAVALSVTTLVLASKGLGKLEPLLLERANTIQKGYYVSDALYISSICFAKLSLVAFFHEISINQRERRIVWVFGLFILLWSTASFLVSTFQCGLPRPWEVFTLHCINHGYFWIIYCIIDMTTDVAIIMLAVNLVAYLKVKLSRKICLVACFAPRIFVIGAALARLIYLYPITPHTHPEYSLWVPVICTQVQVCLSISTVCIPYMKPMFDSKEVRRRRLTGECLQGASKSTYLKPRSSPVSGNLSSRNSNGGAQTRLDSSPRLSTPRPLSPLLPEILSRPSTGRTSPTGSPILGPGLHIPPPPPPSRTSRILNPQNHTPRVLSPHSPQTPSSQALTPQDPSPIPLSPEPLLLEKVYLPPRRRQISSHRTRRRQPENTQTSIPAALDTLPRTYTSPSPSPSNSPRPARPRQPVHRLFPQPRPYQQPPIPYIPRLQVRTPPLSPPVLPPMRTPSRRLKTRDSLILAPLRVNRQGQAQESTIAPPDVRPAIWRDLIPGAGVE